MWPSFPLQRRSCHHSPISSASLAMTCAVLWSPCALISRPQKSTALPHVSPHLSHPWSRRHTASPGKPHPQTPSPRQDRTALPARSPALILSCTSSLVSEASGPFPPPWPSPVLTCAHLSSPVPSSLHPSSSAALPTWSRDMPISFVAALPS